MDIEPIRTEEDYCVALSEAESLMSAEFGMPEGDRLDILVTLVEAYEAKHYRMEAADPIATIKFEAERKALKLRT